MREVSAKAEPIDWIHDLNGDNDEESEYGFNEPTHYEPGDEEEDE